MIETGEVDRNGNVTFTKGDESITVNLNDFESGKAIKAYVRRKLGGGKFA